MKKLMCTLLALAMLCSFMVVNASATNVYSAEGYEIETSYDCSIEGSISEQGYDENILYCDDLSGYMIIGSQKWFDEPEDLYYENYDYYTSGETTVNGNTAAYVEKISEGYYECDMQLYSDYYYYTIGIDAYDEESYNAWLEILDGFTFTYNDELYYEYYENYFPDTSTHWETDYFTIDTDMELAMNYNVLDYDGEPYESYEFCPAGDYDCEIAIAVYSTEDAEKEYFTEVEAQKEWFEDTRDWDICEWEEIKLCGYDAVQHTYIMYEGEFNGYNRDVIVNDGENLYFISVSSDTYTEDLFYALCDIVENDLYFKNAPVDDDKAEDKADKADKSDKESDDKKDDEEKDNSTVIIAVAVIAGVVILGVTAIIVLGKKKKQ